MCHFGLIVSGVLFVQGLQGAKLAAADPLDAILSRAIREVNSLKSASVQISQTQEDKAFETRGTFAGTAVFEKPGGFKLDLAKTGVCVHALITRRARLGKSCGAGTVSGGRLDGR